MSPRIVVEGLGKAYRIGHDGARYRTLREDLMGALRGGRAPSEELWALRDVSLQVADGEVLGIIGRNGAGKSTLLKLLSRIIQPTTGRATVRGRVGTLLEVGAGFHPELTGRDNVFLSGAVLGMSRAEIHARFDEIVAFAGVEPFLDTPVKRYSSGMYLRLAFAVAAHLEAEVLIVDEVLAVGDLEFQEKCLGRMRNVAGQGRTVLFVSHNLGAVQGLCDRVAVLDAGRVVSVEAPTEGIATYLARAGTRPAGGVEFAARPGRGPRMRSATMLADGAAAEAVRMGARAGVRIAFSADAPIRQPYIGLVVHAATGPILSINTTFQPGQVMVPAAEGIVDCDLGPVPLVAGRYSVSLYFGEFNAFTHTAEHALVFDVTDVDGRIPPEDAPMWWPTTFEFR